ncbi:tetratricopeptide repeat protein [Pelosinus sp. sgz500959]|uniref:tetratricopeptide repeat protein n=1 Tax=Pelosinus sp. sgz500959 TaxID=3242472 RepID=UPI003670B055
MEQGCLLCGKETNNKTCEITKLRVCDTCCLDMQLDRENDRWDGYFDTNGCIKRGDGDPFSRMYDDMNNYYMFTLSKCLECDNLIKQGEPPKASGIVHSWCNGEYVLSRYPIIHYPKNIKLYERHKYKEPGLLIILGQAYEDIGQYDQAIEVMMKAVDAEPSARTYGSLGKNYYLARNEGKAQAVFEEAINKGYESSMILQNLASIYLKYGRADEAYQLSKKAISYYRSEVDEAGYPLVSIEHIYIGLAYSALKISLHREAEDYAKNCLEYIDPNPNIYYNYGYELALKFECHKILALVYLEIDSLKEAEENAIEAIKFNSRDHELKRILKLIIKLKENQNVAQGQIQAIINEMQCNIDLLRNQHIIPQEDKCFLVLQSGFPRIDQHILKILQERPDILKIIDGDKELFDMIQALAKRLGTYSLGGEFKNVMKMTEIEFQRIVIKDLRFDLGADVQEHTSQGGGIVDIRYRGVIVELKVERDISDRQSIAEKYAKQPTQYAGVESRQISLVLVLDLTPKINPLGDNREDIRLVDVKTHGGDTAQYYPSKAIVFIVNGNMKSPSEYSK